MTWPKTVGNAAPTPGTAIKILTPHGVGAIAVVEISATGASDVIKAVMGSCPRMATLRSIGGDEGVIDDVLIVPRGPERFELHCHGGLMVVEKLVRWMTHRMGDDAMANQVLDNWRHPQSDLPKVETLWGLRMLMKARHHGAAEWARRLIQAMENGGCVTDVKRRAQWLLAASADLPRLMTGEVRIALIGPPNAGKSSLANFWLGHPMSVTSDIPGTTRDWVEQTVRINGGELEITARLTDTAGMRQTTDELEQLAIAGGISTLQQTQVIVLVMDMAQISDPQHLRPEAWRWAQEHDLADKLHAVPWIAAGNKCDLLPPTLFPGNEPENLAVRISARNGMGMRALQEKVLQVLGVPETLRHPVIDPAQRARLERLILSRDAGELRARLAEIAAADDGMF